MNSRQQILDRIGQASVPAVDLPAPSGPWLTFPDPVDQFRQVVAAVGGQVAEAASQDQLPQAFEQLEVVRQAERIWSRVPALASQGGDWDAIADPHDLEPLQCCVVPGEFGVAENGAVWVTHEVMPHRAPLFVTQHLVLVVPARQIVHNMHEAYARISFAAAQFGMFISGPSKTADIEQSLVIGAHGARSLTVLLVLDSA